MSISARIWRLGQEYVHSIVHEADLAIADLRWFQAYLKAHEALGLIEIQAQALESVMMGRLKGIECSALAEIDAWRRDRDRLHECMRELVRAVHDRERTPALSSLTEVAGSLTASLQSGARALVRLEALVGDVATELAAALREKTDVGN